MMPNNRDLTAPDMNVRPFLRLGWIVLLAGLGSFLLWSAFAPLEKGVISAGTVMVDGYRKVIQSPSEGVVAKIAVKEGQQVMKGDTLVLLSQRSQLALLEAARQRYLAALISERRLQAELAGNTSVTPPESLSDAENAGEELSLTLLRQNQLLQARQQALQQAQENDTRTIAGLIRQRESLLSVSQSKQKSLSLLRRQLTDLRPLMQEGYYPRNRYLDAERQLASLSAEIGEMRSRIVDLDNQVGQLQRTVQQRLVDNRKDIETQLDALRLQISESKKQLTLSEVDLALTRITAPQDGVVMNLALVNEEAVVRAGEQLMEVVPQTPALIVESRLDVAMIDRVNAGMPVTLMFTALNQQQTPKIPGAVTLVSADRQTDASTRQPYYKIQVAVTPQGMAMLKNKEIKPGMPVEVFIRDGERSLLNYLLKPIVDRASRSFTEE